ncbi:MAG: cytochrome b [Alphaproteobacteria bacterium]|nr:MAG: cytochrome b [Alphaproteobacteria bacterium]
MTKPKGYSRLQIALHWLTVILLAAMFLNEDPIKEAFRSLMRTGTFTQTPLVAAHIFGGLTVLALAAIRFAIKLRRGSPPLPENESPLLQRIAIGTHHALYTLMFLVPIAGAIAWFGEIRWMGDVHEIIQNWLLAVAGLHVAGALYQHFILKSDVLMRMRRPES